MTVSLTSYIQSVGKSHHLPLNYIQNLTISYHNLNVHHLSPRVLLVFLPLPISPQQYIPHKAVPGFLPRPKSHHLTLQNPPMAPISAYKENPKCLPCPTSTPPSLSQPQWPSGWAFKILGELSSWVSAFAFSPTWMPPQVSLWFALSLSSGLCSTVAFPMCSSVLVIKSLFLKTGILHCFYPALLFIFYSSGYLMHHILCLYYHYINRLPLPSP